MSAEQKFHFDRSGYLRTDGKPATFIDGSFFVFDKKEDAPPEGFYLGSQGQLVYDGDPRADEAAKAERVLTQLLKQNSQ